MAKMLQVRNVPDDVHRRLKARAAESGMSLSDFVLRELETLAEAPSVEEILARARARTPISTPVEILALLDEARAGR